MAAIAIAVVVFFVAIGLGIWLSLYPIQSVLSIGVWLIASELGLRAADGLTDFNFHLVRYGVPGVLALATAIYTARLDQRLGEKRAYWIVRHVIRLVVVALLTVELHTLIQYGGVCYTVACVQETARLSKGIPVILAIAAVGIAHFALTSKPLRAWWHDYMANLHLRPADAAYLGVTRLVTAVAIPVLVVAGFYVLAPSTKLFAKVTEPSARRVAPPVARRPVAADAAGLTKILEEALGLRVDAPRYADVRRALDAQGVRVTADHPTARNDSTSRRIVTVGDAGYGARGVTEVRYMFSHHILGSISIGRSPSAVRFEQRLAELSRLYKVTKQDHEYATMSGPNVRLTLHVTNGLLVENYEWFGRWEEVK
jgi:hypothetical protein